MNKTMFQKQPLKRWLLFLSLILTLFIGFVITTEASYAATKTMYFKTTATANYYCQNTYNTIVGFYGKGEAVTVNKTQKYLTKNGAVVTYHEIRRFGETVYINSDYLTSKKPADAYRCTDCFKEIILKDKANLYAQPKTSSAAVSCSEQSICTVGRTGSWYKVVVNGQVRFIKKSDPAIQKVKSTTCPVTVKLSCSSTKKSNIKKRVQYQYSLLPDVVRTKFKQRGLTIQVVSKLPNADLEKMGASAYASSFEVNPKIYLKEAGVPYILEGNFLHEAGHILTRLTPELTDKSGKSFSKCFSERKKLSLGAHYQTQYEYAAEIFSIYILRPQLLKSYAPNSYAYLHSLCTI
ncbi:hypothetical protein AALA24_09800 [Anaerovoracaceae bacterium 42-11]